MNELATSAYNCQRQGHDVHVRIFDENGQEYEMCSECYLECDDQDV